MRQPYLHSSAFFSDDRIYRYWLTRRLGMGERMALFVGLNPSTADALKDDPTIRRCVGFCRLWGYDWFMMGNVYAYRSTDPKGLYRVADPVGPENLDHLKWMTQKADLVIAAWGRNRLSEPAAAIAKMILSLPQTRTLGVNIDGTPKHPLYLPTRTQPQAVITGP